MEKVSKQTKIYKFKNFVLDTSQKLLFRNDIVVPLGQKTYECLLLLVKNADKVVTKETFFEEIWKDSFVEDGVLAVNISHLRKSLGEGEDDQKFIETLPRRGYKFLVKVEEDASTDDFPEEFPADISVDNDDQSTIDSVQPVLNAEVSPAYIPTEKLPVNHPVDQNPVIQKSPSGLNCRKFKLSRLAFF